jgi:hypothetical protein
MPYPLDLVVLTADADQKAALQVLLEARAASLGIRQCKFDVLKHTQRDSGCVGSGAELLATQRTQAEHALMVLDWEGSGRESITAEKLEQELEAKLDHFGWEGRARVVVIDPETEIWLWSDSPHVATTFGWTTERGDMRAWLIDRGLLTADAIKPARPKEAMLEVLRATGVKPSAANFAAIARKVSLDRCQDRRFLRLRQKKEESTDPK